MNGTIVFNLARGHRGLLPMMEKVCLAECHDLHQQVPMRQAVFPVNLSDMAH
jgi:hypothetical protein